MPTPAPSILWLVQGKETLPSVRFRVIPFLRQAQALGLEADAVRYPKTFFARVAFHLLGAGAGLAASRKVDVCIVQKRLLSRLELALLRCRCHKLVYDFDDAVWTDQQHSSPPGGGIHWQRFLAQQEAFDHFVAGNEYLASAIRSHTPVLTLASPLDTSVYTPALHPESTTQTLNVVPVASPEASSLHAETAPEATSEAPTRHSDNAFVVDDVHAPSVAALHAEAVPGTSLGPADNASVVDDVHAPTVAVLHAEAAPVTATRCNENAPVGAGVHVTAVVVSGKASGKECSKECSKDCEAATRGEDRSPVIGWMGTDSYFDELLVVAPAIVAATGRPIRVVSNRPPVGALASLCEFHLWTPEGELDLLRSFDIGLMPLTDTPYTRGKCGFKLLQYMACGVVPVASGVGFNREIISHGVNGMLVDSPDAWAEHLQTLLHDAPLRQRLAQEARKTVVERFDVRPAARRLFQALGLLD